MVLVRSRYLNEPHWKFLARGSNKETGLSLPGQQTFPRVPPLIPSPWGFVNLLPRVILSVLPAAITPWSSQSLGAGQFRFHRASGCLQNPRANGIWSGFETYGYECLKHREGETCALPRFYRGKDWNRRDSYCCRLNVTSLANRAEKNREKNRNNSSPSRKFGFKRQKNTEYRYFRLSLRYRVM